MFGTGRDEKRKCRSGFDGWRFEDRGNPGEMGEVRRCFEETEYVKEKWNSKPLGSRFFGQEKVKDGVRSARFNNARSGGEKKCRSGS